MELDADTFDQWYSNMAASPAYGRLHQESLGLPPELDSSSLLPWAGVADICTALGLAPDRSLVDLACGRGGYGLEVARRTGARLTGVDFSAVAVGAAEHATSRFGLTGRARFQVGDLTATGLPAGQADAVMCIDAIQFAEPPLAGLRECLRILTAGGRLAVSCWEPVDPADERLPDRLTRIDMARDLTEAGFDHVEVFDKTTWRAAERDLWEAALRTEANGDPAVESLRNEAARTLSWFDGARRVLATATAPA